MLKVGVTTGLYTIARTEELATSVRKIGFALTRGTSVIEISGDVPHEITETDGKEIRYIVKKQGLDILFHGSLTVPMGLPERGEWRDAQDHMQKSVMSAVYSGCKYVLFHACLNVWLELMTYAGRKLTMSFCDHEGRFISEILKENRQLREWFVEHRGEDYARDILLPEESQQVNSRFRIERSKVEREISRIEARAMPHRDERTGRFVPPELTREQADELINKKHDELAKTNERLLREALLKKLSKGGRWDSEELRGIIGVIDGYHILAHHMFYTKDPLWVQMAKIYGIDVDYSNKNWVDEKWRQAEKKNDRVFKEFYYGTVAAKFLEGHVKKLIEWIDNDLMKKLKDPELKRIARELKVTIEIPDARDATHAGLHLLWRPRQVYAAVKNVRQKLKTDRVWLTMDFEHVATQGKDPIKEMKETVEMIPDFGSIVLSVHSNAPNPMHAHEPLELGDERIYELLWTLRKTGMGKDGRMSYIIYERGGAKDPFAKSIEVLRLCVQLLEKEIKPDKLPMEFYGMKGPVAGDVQRQRQIIHDHAWEPMKDLLEISEEEWTMLSQAAIKKGKRAEQWKRGEFR